MKRFVIAFVLAVSWSLSAMAQQVDVVVLNHSTSVTVDDKGVMVCRQTQSHKLMSSKVAWGAGWDIEVDKNTIILDFSVII